MDICETPFSVKNSKESPKLYFDEATICQKKSKKSLSPWSCFLLAVLIDTCHLLSVGRQFTIHNPSELYVLVSSALLTTRRDMTCTVLKAT